MYPISQKDILAQRFYNQGLSQSFTNSKDLLQASLGIQSQYVHHAFFNLFNRLILSKDEQVLDTLADAILGWGQRQTYHLYDLQTWERLGKFLSTQRIWTEQYFEERGLDLRAESERLKGYLKEPTSRTALSQYYGEDWKVLFRWGGLFVHASRQGCLYQTWTPQDRLVHWQERPTTFQEDLDETLLTQYFSFYGPATLADAAHYFGVPIGRLKPINRNSLMAYDYEGRLYYTTRWQENASIPEVLVLGKFDPLLVSYQYKDILIPTNYQTQVWRKAGQISALILIRGQLAAFWSFSIVGDQIDFVVQPIKRISLKHQAIIKRRFKDFARWMGRTCRLVNMQEVEG